jgi:hypothetical protein
MFRRRVIVAAGIVAAVVLASCTSGDETGSSDTSSSDSPADNDFAGAAPGVTDDTVKIGVTYPDTAALAAVGLDYDLGDYEAVYQALADNINADGGIHGRQVELVVTPFDPTTTTPGEAECVELTEDEDVFLVTGLFLGDGVLCPLEAHTTAAVGGAMTPERRDRALAPWLSWLPDEDRPAEVVATLAEEGDLDGTVGVYAAVTDQATLEDVVVPELEASNVDVVETGINDAPPNDTTAIENSVRLIAERFEAAGVEQVVLVGASAANWLTVMADDPSYRPQLVFLDVTAADAFVSSAATTDTSILEGSVAGGGYGPDQANYDEAEMQECLAILEEAGIDTPAPEDLDPDDPSNQQYQASFLGCADMFLIRAWLDAAGENLDYGTLQAAIDGLEIVLPGDPSQRTYGPGTAGDGNPTAYLYTWDESAQGFVLVED